MDLLSESESIARKLERYYTKAIRDIDKSIKALYGRFEAENNIDYNKAFTLLKGNEYTNWRMTMEEYLDRIKVTGDQALLLELNTLTMRARINRLEALQTEIMAHSAIIAEQEEKVVGDFLREGFSNSYYKGMYDEYIAGTPETIALMKNNKVRLSSNAINKVLTLPWSGGNYSSNIWKNSYFIAKKAQSLVARNIVSGRSIDQITNDFAKLYGGQYRSNIRRLVRTETAYVKSQADVEVYKKLDIEEYEILVTLDNRTSSICREKDGKHYPIDDIKVGVNYPPFHSNCRTTTIRYKKDKKSKTRLAKDKAGKNIKVPLNMKYKDWKKRIENPEKGTFKN